MSEYKTFRDWNDAYTKVLQNRNAAQRAYEKSWREPQERRDKLKAKLDAANIAAETVRTDPNRPASQSMSNLIRVI